MEFKKNSEILTLGTVLEQNGEDWFREQFFKGLCFYIIAPYPSRFTRI